MKARIPKAGGGSMADMLKQAQKMQQDAAALQEELEGREYTAVSGGGMVRGHGDRQASAGPHQGQARGGRPRGCRVLEDMIMAAVNEAMRQADETSAEEMDKLTGSMNLPNLPGMGGLFSKPWLTK